jgi:triacylglycerol lipase
MLKSFSRRILELSVNQLLVNQTFSHIYKKFDAVTARKLAGLIDRCYREQFPARNNPVPWTLEADKYGFSPLGTSNVPFGFVASGLNSKDVYVVFRGTLEFIEWFHDANIQLISYRDGTDRQQNQLQGAWKIVDGILFNNQSPDIVDVDFGYVTAGFRGIYVNLREQMLTALNNLPQDSRIYVTGHSLGGALATLAIPDILKNTHFQDPEQITLYTFASPRCGDRTFATRFQQTQVQHWRIANTEDFVTMLPFPTGNVFRTEPDLPPEPELGVGGVSGVDANPNPVFGFFKAMYDRRKRRMPDYAHTGTPIYFTIHEAALEAHHNLDKVYMLGIFQDPLSNPQS